MAGKWKVFVAEPIGKAGIDLLKQAVDDVEFCELYDFTREQLLEKICDADALITRSSTKVDEQMIEAGYRLKVVARAGVGVDNVDIAAASRHGIVVINAPSGNTLAVAELTMGLILALARKIAPANGSMHEGKWEKKKLGGVQLGGRKLLVVGMGRIGEQVTHRARAFGMDVIGYDPYFSPKKAAALGVTMMNNLTDGLSVADVVTLHMPISSTTRNMIDAKQLKAFKPGAFLINCARGGLVDEAACAEAVRNGRLAGVAFDVFTKEPPTEDNPLLATDIADKVILTPHIGASTQEAQSAVAEIAVSNTLAALRGETYEHAVNLPFLHHRLTTKQKNYLALARKMGILAARLEDAAEHGFDSCHVMLRGNLFVDEDDTSGKHKPYTIAFMKGLLEVILGPDVNYMMAPMLAQERGITIEEGTGEAVTYKNMIEIEVTAGGKTVTLKGTVTEEGRARIVSVNNYWIDFVPNGNMLFFQNHDRPGVIGKIGNMLGDDNVNIANFALGRKNGSGLALGVLEIDSDLSEKVIEALRSDPNMLWATTVSFPEGY